MLREDVRAAVSRADAADANAGKAKDALGRAERRLEEAANALQRQGAIIAQQQAARKEQDEVVDALRREVVQAKDDAKRISDAYAADIARRDQATEELDQLTARYQNLGGGSAGETTLRPPSGGPGGARSERVHAESMKWVPKAVYELAARFRRDHAPRCTKDALARLLASFNRVWHERERARANRMRTEFHRRMVEWRRQLTAACTTDGVALNLELQRCKAEIRQLRALGIAQGKNLRGSLDAVEDTKTATSSAPRLGVVPLREGADSERLLASALTAVDRLSREVIRASRDNESLREVVGTTDRGGFEAGARWTSERCVTLVDNLATDVETLGASFANRMAAMPPDGEDFLVRMCRAETQLLRDVRTLISRCRDQVSDSNEEASTAGGFAAQKVHEEDGVGGGAFDEATAEAVEEARKRFGGEAAREYGDLVDDDVDDALRMLM